MPGKSELGTNSDSVSSLGVWRLSLLESASDSNSHTGGHIFLQDDAADFSGEDGIRKDTATSHGVWRSTDTNDDDTDNKSLNEEEEALARMIRSPQEFDDDVELSSSEVKGNKAKGKGRGKLNAKRKGKGKGKGNEE